MKYRALVCLCLAMFCFSSTANASDKVLHTLKPLYLITSELAADKIDSELMAMGTQHAHSYTLKFSDLRQLQQADLLVWLGPEFEQYLHKPLVAMDQRPADFRFLSSDEHSNEHGEESHTHIWLDPIHIIESLPALAAALIEVQPQHAEFFEQRVVAYTAQLQTLHERLEDLFSSLQGIGVVSDHGGINAFLQRYGLRHMGSLRNVNHGSISLKQVESLRADITLGNTRCLALSDAASEQEAEDLQQQMFAGLKLNVVRLDLLGQSASSYEQLIEAIAEQLSACMRS